MEQLGRGHPALRRIRALRRDAKLRGREGVFLAEGIHLAQEALASHAPVREAIVSPRLENTREGPALLAALRDRAVPCRTTSDALLDSLQDARSPQPILLVVRRRSWTLDQIGAGDDRAALVTVACDIQDPGNLGAMIRTTDAAGGTALVVTGSGVDRFHPRTVRATMGSIFRLPLLEAPLPDLIDRLHARGIVVLGTHPRNGRPHHEVDLRRPTALLFGGEARGLPDAGGGKLDGTVRIRMRSGVESLSVGAAAAVLLFEAARQREAANGD